METWFPAETNRKLRGHRFYPSKPELAKLPKLRDQEYTADPIVHVHYFSSVYDYYATEFGTGEDLGRIFGYARFASNPHGAEWGHADLTEMEQLLIRVDGLPLLIERDLYWRPRLASEIPNIHRR